MNTTVSESVTKAASEKLLRTPDNLRTIAQLAIGLINQKRLKVGKDVEKEQERVMSKELSLGISFMDGYKERAPRLAAQAALSIISNVTTGLSEQTLQLDFNGDELKSFRFRKILKEHANALYVSHIFKRIRQPNLS